MASQLYLRGKLYQPAPLLLTAAGTNGMHCNHKKNASSSTEHIIGLSCGSMCVGLEGIK